MSDLRPPMTLKEVAPYVRRSVATCHDQLSKGTFPIRYIDTRPYLFAYKDVMAYAERGEKTNPHFAITKSRQLFGRVVRKKAQQARERVA